MMRRLREWLLENKVFFETLVALLLGAMAIILSLGSLENSRLQTRIQQAQAQPIFVIQAEYVLNPDSQKYEDIVFRIRNTGQPLKSFSNTVHSFLIVNRTLEPKSGATIPIVGYLPTNFPTGDATGLLWTLKGGHNNAAVFDLARQIALLTQNQADYFGLQTLNIFEMQYLDLLGEKHQVFYRVDEFGGSPMEDNQANQLMALEKSHFPVELSTIHAEDLLKQAGFVTKP